VAEEMTKAKLIDLAQAERQRFMELIQPLSQGQMLQPGVQGVWSVKDIAAHLVAWEERMVLWLNQAARGETPAPFDLSTIDQMNEQTYQERKDWPLAHVMADLQRVSVRSAECIRAVSDEDLLTPKRLAWLGQEPLWWLVAANTFWHYPSHAKAVRTWLAEASPDPLEYYAYPGSMTNPRRFAPLFDRLPAGVDKLVPVVQGLLVHIYWAERYGLQVPEARRQEVQLRSVVAKVARIRELDGRPLTEARPLDRRLVNNCRDYSVLLCAMLRHQGVPARARCGFGAYFMPNHYEDHWVCEYWSSEQGRWVLVDAQLDALQRETLRIPFDPLDVPRDQFIVAGQAWQMCRAGQADPDHFGILDMHGLWFVRGNLIRDMLALNKVEILPWDGGFGFLAESAPPDHEQMDRLATLTTAGNEAFAEVRALYAQDERLHVPAEWYNT
jgi:hypothetical protein